MVLGLPGVCEVGAAVQLNTELGVSELSLLRPQPDPALDARWV